MSEVLRRVLVEYVKGFLSKRINKQIVKDEDRDEMIDRLQQDMDTLQAAFEPYNIPCEDGLEPFAVIQEIVELLECKDSMIIINWKKIR